MDCHLPDLMCDFARALVQKDRFMNYEGVEMVLLFSK